MVKMNKTMGLSLGGRDNDKFPVTSIYVTIPDLKYSEGPSLSVGRMYLACSLLEDSEDPELKYFRVGALLGSDQI